MLGFVLKKKHLQQQFLTKSVAVDPNDQQSSLKLNKWTLNGLFWLLKHLRVFTSVEVFDLSIEDEP